MCVFEEGQCVREMENRQGEAKKTFNQCDTNSLSRGHRQLVLIPANSAALEPSIHNKLKHTVVCVIGRYLTFKAESTGLYICINKYNIDIVVFNFAIFHYRYHSVMVEIYTIQPWSLASYIRLSEKTVSRLKM